MSIQTTFNKSIQGTNNIYGDIQSNNDASFNNLTSNNLTINGKLLQTNTGVINNILGNTTIGNSIDSRGTLTNNFSSTTQKSSDTDIQDANRAFCNDNVSTNTSNNLISAICLQINPFAQVNTGRAIGDIMLIRENNTTSSFMMSAFQGTTYRDIAKFGYNDSFIRGFLKVNSNQTPTQAIDVNGNIILNGSIQQTSSATPSYYTGALLVGSNNTGSISSDKLTINGTAMIGNEIRMNNVSPSVLPNTNTIISWISGIVNYFANGVNTRTDTSNNITHKVETIFQNLQSTYQSKALLSSSGLLQHYPSWTTLLNVNTSGTSTAIDIGNGSSFPYFDNTNFRRHIIHFQGYCSGGNSGGQSTPKWNCRLYFFIDGSIYLNSLENSINEVQRTAPTTLVSLDATNTNNYAVIMSNIEVIDTFDFFGTIEINNTFGGFQQIKIDCCYNKSGVGSTKSFGSIRSTTKTTNYNGIRFLFTPINGFHRANVRYYLEST